MPSTSPDIAQEDLVRATEATKELLDELRLDTYLFEVESRGGAWQVKLECATAEGAWQTLTMTAPPGLLVTSLDDDDARRELISQWGERLADCKARRQP